VFPSYALPLLTKEGQGEVAVAEEYAGQIVSPKFEPPTKWSNLAENKPFSQVIFS